MSLSIILGMLAVPALAVVSMLMVIFLIFCMIKKCNNEDKLCCMLH